MVHLGFKLSPVAIEEVYCTTTGDPYSTVLPLTTCTPSLPPLLTSPHPSITHPKSTMGGTMIRLGILLVQC